MKKQGGKVAIVYTQYDVVTFVATDSGVYCTDYSIAITLLKRMTSDHISYLESHNLLSNSACKNKLIWPGLSHVHKCPPFQLYQG